MRIEVTRRVPVVRSYRTDRAMNLFNVGVDLGQKFRLEADLPVSGAGEPEGDWRIGVVAGPSGSGKSTIGAELAERGWTLWGTEGWPHDEAILDAIGPAESFDDVAAALASVGLGTIPSWLRPYRVLSNGERFRAELARLLVERPDRVVIDEFSALHVDEPVLTPTGWVPIRDIEVGDEVIGSDGLPTKVIDVPFRGPAPMYRARTGDGVEVLCSSDHLWSVRKRHHRRMTTVRAEDAVAMLPGVGARWWLPDLGPVQYAMQPDDALPIDPYALGVLLGDGSLGPTTPHWAGLRTDVEEMVGYVRTEDELRPMELPSRPEMLRYQFIGGRTTQALIDLGLRTRVPRTKGGPERDVYAVCHEKWIPEAYLRSEPSQRLALLRGLMDTDGCQAAHHTFFSTSSPALARDVAELVRSLGGFSVVRGPTAHANPNSRDQYTVAVRMSVCPFVLRRKADRWKPAVVRLRELSSVTPTGFEAEAKCITVAAEDGLFVTRDFVLTHNSVVDRRVAQIGSQAFAKAWRRGAPAHVVLLTPHFDVLPWVKPDWLVQTTLLGRTVDSMEPLVAQRPEDPVVGVVRA